MGLIIWKPIPTFERYEASSDGRVRNRETGYVLTPQLIRRYYYVKVRVGTKPFMRRINRLVCLAFYGRPRGKKNIARHRDGKNFHNHYKNLRWGTIFDNARDSIRHGVQVRGEGHPNATTTKKKIEAVRRDYKAHMKGRNKAANGFLHQLKKKHKLSFKQICCSVYDPNYYLGSN